MKKLLIALMLLLGLTSRADTFVTSANIAATTNSTVLSTTPFVLTSLTLTTTNDTPTTVLIYDGYSNYTNATAYTNWSSYTTNLVSSYLTSTGTTNTVTNTVVWPYATVVAAGSYATPVTIGAVVTKTVPYVYTYPPNTRGILFYSGKLSVATSAAGTSIMFSYRSP